MRGDALARLWERPGALSTLLLPASLLYGAVARLRRARAGGSGRARTAGSGARVPVVVVGNLALGGTGKTPLVAALVDAFAGHGVRCGIVSRGYGGARQLLPTLVAERDSPARVGDEPAMLARATGVPVAVCVHRDLAVAHLAARPDVDLVLSDDGLQHYAMARDVEICVVDAERGLGNGRLLPAGPLREAPGRLAEVDLIALRTTSSASLPVPDPGLDARLDAAAPGVPRAAFAVELAGAARLGTGEGVGLERWRGRRVHAVAGIGRPERFFEALRARGMEVVPHPFPDHHRFAARDVDFGDADPVLVTSKDAVKLAALSPVPPGVIEVRSRAVLSAPLAEAVAAAARRLVPGAADRRPSAPGAGARPTLGDRS